MKKSDKNWRRRTALSFALFFSLLSSTSFPAIPCHELYIVVDGIFQTGQKIPRKAEEMGLGAVALRSGETLPVGGKETFFPEDYRIDVVHEGEVTPEAVKATIAKLAEQLEVYARRLGMEKPPKIVGISAGADSGTTLADLVANSLGIPGNPIATAAARVEKVAFGEALRANGVRAVKEQIVRTSEEVYEWASKHGKWPILVKPPKSTGSDTTRICKNSSELLAAFQEVHGKPNQMGKINDGALLQEYLKGPQFAVNTVSYLVKGTDGQTRVVRFISDIWYQARKPGYPSYVYDHNILLPYNGKIQNALRLYGDSVLDAVEFRVGATHLEVILTEDGPVAIDLNSRLPGAGMPALVALATGRDPIAMSINATTGRSDSALTQGYTLKAIPVVVYIRTRGDATMSHRMKDELDRLKREGVLYKYKFNHPENHELAPTIDSDTNIAQIELLHPDIRKLRAVLKLLRDAEERGDFENRN